MKKFLLRRVSILAGLLIASFWVLAQEVTIPTPDVALTFEGTPETYTVEVPDVSGNNNHAYWYNYFRYDGEHPDSALYAGYHTDEGKFDGSWYISGYHQSCCNMCSSSEDFILLAGNNNANDIAECRDPHPLFHTGMKSLTVMFWFKSNRDYTLTNKIPCPKGTSLGMHEQELLFSHGKRNGIAIANDKGFYNVKVGYRPPEGTEVKQEIRLVYNGVNRVEKDWQHIAVTFDGTQNGKLTVYVDGEIGVSGYADPNPVESGYDSIRTDRSSTEIGAQNNGGLFGDPGDGFWTGAYADCCCPEGGMYPKYRTGWPAGGYYDEFVFFKDSALTQEQIQLIMNQGIVSAMSGGNQNLIKTKQQIVSSVYPNPATGTITVRMADQYRENMTIFNVIGKVVLQKQVINGDRIDISSLETGIYFVRLGENISKLVIQ